MSSPRKHDTITAGLANALPFPSSICLTIACVRLMSLSLTTSTPVGSRRRGVLVVAVAVLELGAEVVEGVLEGVVLEPEEDRIKASMCRDLLPGAAHMSRMVWSECTSNNKGGTMETISCRLK